MSIPIEYRSEGGRVYASILLPNGERLGTSVPLAPIVGAVCDQVGATDLERVAAYEMVGGDVDIVGALCGEDSFDEVGARRSRRRSRRKARRKRVFGKIKRGLKRVAKPIVKAAKKIAKSKLVKGLVKVVKKIPIYGQLVSAAAKGIKGAAKLGKKIKRRVRGGGRGGRLLSGKRLKKAFSRKSGAQRRSETQATARGLRLRSGGAKLLERGDLEAEEAAPRRRSSSRSRRGGGEPRKVGPSTFELTLSTGRTALVRLV